MTERSQNVTWHEQSVTAERRAGAALGATGATVWITGLPASGKSTIAVAVRDALLDRRRAVYLLDGDNLRHGLNGDLGFTAADRAENVRRTGEVARLFADAGLVVIASLVSPYAADRERVRAAHAREGLTFVEVYVNTPLEECERRDPKGLYRKARAGELPGLTGVDDPYEPPVNPELELRASGEGPERAAAAVLALLGD